MKSQTTFEYLLIALMVIIILMIVFLTANYLAGKTREEVNKTANTLAKLREKGREGTAPTTSLSKLIYDTHQMLKRNIYKFSMALLLNYEKEPWKGFHKE